jgi:DNA-binding SARP family transcriptional activator/tetratricopeptide (TPR) repeat protein
MPNANSTRLAPGSRRDMSGEDSSTSGGTVQVRLLGPVDVTVDGVPRAFPGLRRKSVLAVLALHPGQVVSADRLIDTVWGGEPPATVTNSLQGHISYLRRALRAPGAIVARPPGYLLNLSPDAVDLGQAMRLIGSNGHGDHAGSTTRLTAALQLWRGPSLADVTEVAWLRNQAQRLDENRLDAVERLAEARLALGEHVALAVELDDLTAQYPFREHLHQLLMLALYRCGRQADALAAYHRLRQALGGELGIDPGPALRGLEVAILRQDPGLDLPPSAISASPTAPARITPAQLPPSAATFSGRRDQLAWLSLHLPPPAADDDPTRPQAATVVVASGTAGVGKTTLAVHWAQQVKDRFPDGQLYVNLRGFDPGGVVMDPAEAVYGFVHALGIPPDQIPASAQAQASLYRSVLAGKRVLIVADNARDEQQVRPLLPGAPGCLVVVTSRHQLPGLVATDGAHPLTLDRPTEAEARRILAQRLGTRRVEAEPEAVDEIIACCARLPLALAIAAARAALAPALPLATLAVQLRDAATLDPFDSTDPATNIRAVFSWSYHTLSDPAARLFRLLGPCPGSDIALPAAASVAGRPAPEVRPLLAELTRAHLLSETSPGRYGLHELLRAYAIEQTHRYDTTGQQAAARHRFLDHHLQTAHAASLLLKPGRSRIELVAPAAGVTPHQLADHAAVQAWFAAERSVLLATIGRQPDGHDRHTWQLAWALAVLLATRGDWRDNERVQRVRLQAAQRLGDRSAQAHAHRCLGLAHTDLGMLTEARHHSQAALRLFEQIDNALAMTDVYLILGRIAEGEGDVHQALTQFEHAHRSYRRLGHPAGQAYAAHNIGYCHGLLGDHHKGLPYGQEALDILTEIGDLEAMANTWDGLGDLHFGLKDQPRAEHCYQQAIALYRTVGDRFREADVHTTLGDRHHHTGNPDAARQAWQHALAILEDIEPDAAAQVRTRLDAGARAGWAARERP